MKRVYLTLNGSEGVEKGFDASALKKETSGNAGEGTNESTDEDLEGDEEGEEDMEDGEDGESEDDDDSDAE